MPFPSPFNPIRATLDVIYLFIYLFSKDVTDSYRGPEWGLLPGETVTNVQPSIRQFVLRWRVMVLVIDCVCVCVCTTLESIVQIWVCFQSMNTNRLHTNMISLFYFIFLLMNEVLFNGRQNA